MSKKAVMLLAVLIGAVVVTAVEYQRDQVPTFDTRELKPGGDMTVKRLSHNTFIGVGGNVDRINELEFWSGFSFFRDPWVVAPASTTGRDGVGPLFNTRSCITCHHDGGRGPMSPVGLHKPSSLLIRIGSTVEGVNAVDPNYGGQIQPRSITLLNKSVAEQPQGEAMLDLQYETLKGQYADGSSYELIKPSYTLSHFSHGPLAANLGLSPRYAPSIYGMGLLDAISDKDLLAQEDINDADNDGISARYNRVVDRITNEQQAIGRFGFKALHPSLDQQVAAAFVGDIGITSPLFPDENCTKVQVGCQQVAKIGHPTGLEAPERVMRRVNAFSAYIGVQPARRLTSKTVQKGRTLFYQTGCNACHTTSYTTDKDYALKELANQKIWPYTDLALHDMGEGLSDGITESDANGREWRTPPLWSIGLQKELSTTARFLHDGRARSIEEAILWHGGEATTSQQQFIQMTKAQRDSLLAFIKAI